MKKKIVTRHEKNNSFEIDPEKVAENPGLISYPHHIGSVAINPEDMGKTKGRSLAAMHEQTNIQLRQIYEQMQTLARQAHAIKKRVQISEKIYLSRIGFEPVTGNLYYLYEKEDGESVISMVSPAEWGKKMPYRRHLAILKLLSDYTWEIIENNYHP